MKRFWTTLLILSLLLACCACPALAAETVQQDGIIVTLLTDREIYAAGEPIRVTLNVQNTNAFPIQNVYTEVTAPDGIKLIGGERTFVGELTAGAMFEQEITGTEKEPDTPVLPQTGDDSHIGMWSVLLLLSLVGGVYLAVFRRNGAGARWMSLFLCLLMVGSLLPVGSFARAENVQKTITVDKIVTYVNRLMTLTGIVTYDAVEDVVEPTAAPTVEPTATPTATPTVEPTATPTATPTVEPTATPTATPTVEPTATPTTTPTSFTTSQLKTYARFIDPDTGEPLTELNGSLMITMEAGRFSYARGIHSKQNPMTNVLQIDDEIDTDTTVTVRLQYIQKNGDWAVADLAMVRGAECWEADFGDLVLTKFDPFEESIRTVKQKNADGTITYTAYYPLTLSWIAVLHNTKAVVQYDWWDPEQNVNLESISAADSEYISIVLDEEIAKEAEILINGGGMYVYEFIDLTGMGEMRYNMLSELSGGFSSTIINPIEENYTPNPFEPLEPGEPLYMCLTANFIDPSTKQPLTELNGMLSLTSKCDDGTTSGNYYSDFGSNPLLLTEDDYRNRLDTLWGSIRLHYIQKNGDWTKLEYNTLDGMKKDYGNVTLTEFDPTKPYVSSKKQRNDDGTVTFVIETFNVDQVEYDLTLVQDAQDNYALWAQGSYINGAEVEETETAIKFTLDESLVDKLTCELTADGESIRFLEDISNVGWGETRFNLIDSLDNYEFCISNPVNDDSTPTPTYDTTFTMSHTEVSTGVPVTFTVQSPSASTVQLIVDGSAYETYPVVDGSCTFEREFTKAGARSVQMLGRDADGNEYPSAEQTLVVTAEGNLDAPGFAEHWNGVAGQDLTINWTASQNAEEYVVYLYYDGYDIWKETTSGTSITIPGSQFFTDGTYTIDLLATGENYSQSSSGAFVSIAKPETYATLSGRVVDEGNAALKDVNVHVFVRLDIGFAYADYTTSDENGNWSVDELIPGCKYELVLNKDGYEFEEDEVSYLAVSGANSVPTLQGASLGDGPLYLSAEGIMHWKTANKQKVTVYAPEAWQATAEGDWFSVDVEGDDIIVTMPENTSSSKRTGSITVTSGEYEVTIEVIQEGVSSLAFLPRAFAAEVPGFVKDKDEAKDFLNFIGGKGSCKWNIFSGYVPHESIEHFWQLLIGDTEDWSATRIAEVKQEFLAWTKVRLTTYAAFMSGEMQYRAEELSAYALKETDLNMSAILNMGAKELGFSTPDWSDTKKVVAALNAMTFLPKKSQAVAAEYVMDKWEGKLYDEIIWVKAFLNWDFWIFSKDKYDRYVEIIKSLE